MNLKYLDSDKVAVKDMNQLVGEYDDDKLNDVMTAIEAINKYGLIDGYRKTYGPVKDYLSKCNVITCNCSSDECCN